MYTFGGEVGHEKAYSLYSCENVENVEPPLTNQDPCDGYEYRIYPSPSLNRILACCDGPAGVNVTHVCDSNRSIDSRISFFSASSERQSSDFTVCRPSCTALEFVTFSQWEKNENSNGAQRFHRQGNFLAVWKFRHGAYCDCL